MLSIEDCKKIDPRLALLSDEEVEKIRDHLYLVAELAIENFLEELTVPKIPLGYGLKKKNV
jgi:hypothetical protein